MRTHDALDLSSLVGAYADRFHRAVPPTHHVASPLGAWLLLALAAQVDDELTELLVEPLGCSTQHAGVLARGLVARPHPVLHLAAAAWSMAGVPAVEEWLARLPDEVETGPVPSQQQADEWARRHTMDLITEFPVDSSAALLVLASAVACAISWRDPFERIDATRCVLPRADGFDTVRELLRTPSRGQFQHAIADTPDGLVAVHCAPSTDADMQVVSVIADPAVAPAAVLRHAHTIATAIGRGSAVPRRRSLFDLDLGAGHSWLLTEGAAPSRYGTERFESVLPAWSAKSKHPLLAMPDIGFDSLQAVLYSLVGPGPCDAVQSAVAQYTREGFKAAAVTAIAVAMAAVSSPEALVRTARVEFTHPFAVVAVAVDPRDGPWSGVSLFSSWVAQADEPS